MREFKFDIDDWTGGNTLGKSMGDAVGSTVDGKLFSIRTHPTKEYSFINNGIIEITVDWGDGTVEDLSSSVDRHSHVFEDNKYQPRIITFGIRGNVDKLKECNFRDVGLISIDKDIHTYSIYTGDSTGTIHRYLSTVDNEDYKIDYLNFGGNNIRRIGIKGFSYLNIYHDIKIPDSVIEIHNRAFEYSTTDGNLILSNKDTNIHSEAFYAMLANSLILPKFTTIPKDAFVNMRTYNNLVMPETVVDIQEGAFREFQVSFNGAVIIFNDRLKSIGNKAFMHVETSIAPLKLNNGLEYIGDDAFYGALNINGTLEIPSSVKEIGESAFYGCVRLDKLIFNEGLSIIKDNTFKECRSIANDIVLPESLKYIGKNAFEFNLLYNRFITIFVHENTEIENENNYKSVVFKRYTIVKRNKILK